MADDNKADDMSNMISRGGGEGSRFMTLSLKRRLYTVDALDQAYPQKEDVLSWSQYFKGKCHCTGPRFCQALLGSIPLIGVLRNYKWRADLLMDLMAGLSVAFLQLPQGMALSILATLPPVYGLYTTLFPVIIYMFFGTSRHMSIGTNAVTALLTAAIIAKELDVHVGPQITMSNASPTDSPLDSTATASVSLSAEEELEFKVGVATAVCFLCGLFMTVAGLLRFGFVTCYLSSSFVGGFTTAASFHILTSQVNKLFHIKITAFSGAGKIVKTYIDIFKHIGESNLADVIISIISILFLLAITIFVNERYKTKLKVPLPVQLILVVISTMVSHFAQLEKRFGINVVGNIPTGIPTPVVPKMESLGRIASDSFVVAVLTFTISISLVKLTARVHNYSVDDNKELLAYGLSNFLSSFFSCFPCCNAPPRAMILSNVGAKSTFNAIFCAILILIVLLAAGPLFQALPVAVLAAMICVAMKNLLLQVTQLPFLWRTSKPDFIIWTLTCLVSIFVDLDIGIVVGIAVSILVVIIKGQIASGSVGTVSVSEDLVCLNQNRSGMKASKNFSIFYFPTQLYFATADRFKHEIFSKVLNPDLVKLSEDDRVTASVLENGVRDLKYIVLECSAMTFMDLTGANMLKTVAIAYRKADVTVIISNCPDYSLKLLEQIDYFKEISRDTVYFDILDAVNFIQETYESYQTDSSCKL